MSCPGAFERETMNVRFNVGDATMNFTVKEVGQPFERVVGSVLLMSSPLA